MYIVNPYIYIASSASYLVDDYAPDIALSLRKVSSSATNCIRVRRSSDNAEQDIGFSGNDLDTASLLSFVGANDGFVTKWYNQSSSGATYDAIETTTANQPRIVNSGTLETSGGKPAIYGKVNNNTQLAVSTGFNFTLGSGGTYFGVFTVNGAGSTAVSLLPFTCETNGSYYFGAIENGAVTNPHANFGTPSYYNNGTILATADRNEVYDIFAVNTLKLLRVTNLVNSAAFPLVLQYPSITTLECDSYTNEIIVFRNTTSGATNSGVETNINSYYTIT